MPANLEQAEAMIREYQELIKIQQGEIIELQKQLHKMNDLISELKFDLSCELNKEYDV